MQEVTVRKAELLEKLIYNRDQHRSEFEKAIAGYRTRLHQELERRIKDLEAGRKIEQYIGLPEPADHTKDYNRVISMVEMSIDDEITLNARDFQQYVLDDWAWKQEFASTNSLYT